MRPVITFDFDDTLLWWGVTRDEDGEIEEMVPMGQNPHTWHRLMRALDSGAEVHVVTARQERRRADTEAHLAEWGVLDRLAGVHFTNGQLKRDMLEVLGSRLHHDDDLDELENLPPGCRGWQAPIHPSWGMI